MNVILCCWDVSWHLLTDMVVMFTNINHYFKWGLVNNVDLTVVGQYVDIYIYIYIYIRVLLVHKIQEIHGCALFVWWITLIYLYDHVCIHLIEVCVIVIKKKKNESDKCMPNYIHFVTCFMPDRPLDYEGISHILKL